MIENKDVTIISAFGRGHWLASELRENGYKVSLVDVTSRLGRWAPEDWEGPFGFFHTEQLKASQIERLTEEDYHEAVDEGFTLLLKDGPIEFKGVLSQFWLNQKSLHGFCSDYLSSFDHIKAEDRKKVAQQIMDISFSKTWLIHLAHQLASNTYSSNAESVKYSSPLPLFASYSLRRVSRRGLEKSLNWCQSKGVDIYKLSELQDYSVDENKKHCVELKSDDWSGVLKSENLIWCLSSEESEHILSTKFLKMVYPKSLLSSSWSWVRFRVQLDKVPATQNLPMKFFMIQSLQMPWTHDNFLAIQQTVKVEDYDVWLKIPSQHRFRRDYLKTLGDKITEILSSRIPQSQAQIIDMPQDYQYDYQVLGPSRFSLYENDELKKHLSRLNKSISYSTPETWERMDWVGRFQHDEKILQNFLQVKA